MKLLMPCYLLNGHSALISSYTALLSMLKGKKCLYLRCALTKTTFSIKNRMAECCCVGWKEFGEFLLQASIKMTRRGGSSMLKYFKSKGYFD